MFGSLIPTVRKVRHFLVCGWVRSNPEGPVLTTEELDAGLQPEGPWLPLSWGQQPVQRQLLEREARTQLICADVVLWTALGASSSVMAGWPSGCVVLEEGSSQD